MIHIVEKSYLTRKRVHREGRFRLIGRFKCKERPNPEVLYTTNVKEKIPPIIKKINELKKLDLHKLHKKLELLEKMHIYPTHRDKCHHLHFAERFEIVEVKNIDKIF